jgi:hypothetical protein
MTDTQVIAGPRRRHALTRREVLRRLARLDVVAEPEPRRQDVVRVRTTGGTVACVPPGLLSHEQMGIVLRRLNISWQDFQDMR